MANMTLATALRRPLGGLPFQLGLRRAPRHGRRWRTARAEKREDPLGQAPDLVDKSEPLSPTGGASPGVSPVSSNGGRSSPASPPGSGGSSSGSVAVELPTTSPVLSYAFAGATAVLSTALLLTGGVAYSPLSALLATPFEMAKAISSGSNWEFGTLLTSNFVCSDWLLALSLTAVLWAAGPYAERLLGSTRIGLAFLLAGAAWGVSFIIDVTDLVGMAPTPEDYVLLCTAGPVGSMVGVAAAALAAQLRNLTALNQEQHLQHAVAAVALAAFALAAEPDAALLTVPAIMGVLMGLVAGPQLKVSRQVKYLWGEEASGAPVSMEVASTVAEDSSWPAFTWSMAALLGLFLWDASHDFAAELFGACLARAPDILAGAPELLERNPLFWGGAVEFWLDLWKELSETVVGAREA